MKLRSYVSQIFCLSLLLGCANLIATYHNYITNESDQTVIYKLYKGQSSIALRHKDTEVETNTLKPGQPTVTSSAIENDRDSFIKVSKDGGNTWFSIETCNTPWNGCDCRTSNGCSFYIKGKGSDLHIEMYPR